VNEVEEIDNQSLEWCDADNIPTVLHFFGSERKRFLSQNAMKIVFFADRLAHAASERNIDRL
jgi:hypothetical protein